MGKPAIVRGRREAARGIVGLLFLVLLCCAVTARRANQTTVRNVVLVRGALTGVLLHHFFHMTKKPRPLGVWAFSWGQ